MSDFLDRLADRAKKQPMVKCEKHGVRPVLGICAACSTAQLKQLAEWQKACEIAHGHLISAANDCERFGRRIEKLEAVIEEITEVTHKQYCIDGLHGALPEGQHHSACQYLRELKAEADQEEKANADLAAESRDGAGEQLVAGDSTGGGNNPDGDTASGSGIDLKEELQNEVPKETDRN